MTTHNAFPLRGGKAWPGINTLGGKLDDGSGQLTDASKNVMINTADLLAKRKGFTRGMDEQFVGAVCGLHKYTDECGIEYLLVADENQINIRTPFFIPVFTVSDSYPNDGFSGTTSSVDLSRWADASLGYRHVASTLNLRAGVLAPLPLEWFKEATSSSYKVATKVSFPNDVTTETVDHYIKAGAADGKGSLRLRVENSGGAVTVTLAFIDVLGVATELEQLALIPTGTSLDCDVTDFSYDASTRKVAAEVFISGNGTPAQPSATLTAIQDVDLGQKTLVALSASGTSTAGLDEISSEPI